MRINYLLNLRRGTHQHTILFGAFESVPFAILLSINCCIVPWIHCFDDDFILAVVIPIVRVILDPHLP